MGKGGEDAAVSVSFAAGSRVRRWQSKHHEPAAFPDIASTQNRQHIESRRLDQQQHGFRKQVSAAIQGMLGLCDDPESCVNAQQLNNPDLLHNLSFVNGDWVRAKSGKTFEVVGQSSIRT